MAEHSFIVATVIVLCAAVLGVFLAERLKLGPVLGYLVAGLVIGPAGFALVANEAVTQTLAELGVVFLLFMVGLELPLERLRVMPMAILWLGGLQILLTAALIAILIIAFGGSIKAAVVIGGALALSSTAIVLRLLADSSELSTRFGRITFGVLMLQDLAVGPFIVAVFALASGPASTAAALGLAVVKAAAAMAIILGIGRFAMRPLFRLVAGLRSSEVFAALTILVILCASFATQLAGLSMAFGAFLAGMMLADSPYRHQVAVEIEPFRGLLLGLFFMTVGMSLDVELLRQHWIAILPVTLALLFGKAALLGALATMALPAGQAVRLGLLLAQGGEFAFVLLGVGLTTGILSASQQQQLAVIVILSMMATPALSELGRRLSPHLARRRHAKAMGVPEESPDLIDHVIIAGYGRVGRDVSRRLTAAGVAWVALDLDAYRVAAARRQGLKVYYGDADRPDILASLAVDRARAVVITLDDHKSTVQLTATLHYVMPQLPILARAYDESHAADLSKAGATHIIPEPTSIGATFAEILLGHPTAVSDEIQGAQNSSVQTD